MQQDKEQIREAGNKLIAEFDGLEVFTNPFRGIKAEDGLYRRFNSDGTQDIVGDLKYHSSWDWLMPVVEKIETMIIKVNITTNSILFRVDTEGDHDVVIYYKKK